jgi:predicted DNA-binding antitoxin AbrB/MazE fold protein
MNAYKKHLTIDNFQQLILTNLPFKPGQKVEVIILSEDDKETDNKNIDTDETPTEKIIEGIYQGLHEAITGKTIPLEQMWEGIDEQ